MFGKGKSNLMDVHAAQFYDLLNGKPDAVLVDFRTREEFESGHIPGARLLDVYNPDFQDELESWDRTARYLVYCRSGSRSKAAGRLMARMGFAKVFNLANGLLDWHRPLELGPPRDMERSEADASESTDEGGGEPIDAVLTPAHGATEFEEP